MIVTNELRSAFSSWSDRLIAIVVILIALAALHSSLSHRSFMLAASAISTLTAVIGAGTARFIRHRLDFHAYDGALAAAALDPGTRRHYLLSIHVVVCGTVAACSLIGRPETVLLAPFGYLAGVGSCHLARRMVPEGGVLRQSAWLRPIRAFLQRPTAGALAAILVMLPLLLLRSIEPGPFAAFIGLISAIAALLLTMLDDKTVRFMTVSGYSAGRIIEIQARSLLVFVSLTIPASLILSRGLTAIVVAGVGSAALILVTARILAFRVHSKRIGDTVVSICAGVFCIMGFMLPVLLPLVVIAIFWHLQRRSAPVTWMLT